MSEASAPHCEHSEPEYAGCRMCDLKRFAKIECSVFDSSSDEGKAWIDGFMSAWLFAFAKVSTTIRAEFDGMVAVALEHAENQVAFDEAVEKDD